MTTVITAAKIQVKAFSYLGLQLIDQLLTNETKEIGSMPKCARNGASYCFNCVTDSVQIDGWIYT